MHAVRCGADAIGFVFAPSPRQVSESHARTIREKLPPFVSVVGVFVDPDPRQARKIFEETGLDFIQLYGGDERRFLEESGLDPLRLIRAVSIGSEADLQAANETVAADRSADARLIRTGVARLDLAVLATAVCVRQVSVVTHLVGVKGPISAREDTHVRTTAGSVAHGARLELAVSAASVAVVRIPIVTSLARSEVFVAASVLA